jgi:hypothetical protein
MRTSFYALLTVAVVLAAGGAHEAEARPSVLRPDPPKCVAGSFERRETNRVAYGAAVRRRAIAYTKPRGREIARFGRVNVNRVRTVFGVIGARVNEDCVPVWYRVRLPRRPNGVTGWVRARDVSVAKVRTRILVDLSARRVMLFRDGRRVLSTRAAIGSSATPTPVGTYYVNQRLVPSDPRGPFGPGAIGISAFSEVLTGWTQGGPIAIHGTNQPGLIGQAVSNGCIRIRNEVLRRIFGTSVAGTPVVVRG